MAVINHQMPWIVALIIGVLTVIVNVYINRSQLKSRKESLKNEILLSTRKKWINDLRDCVSEYISSHELSKLIAKFDKKGSGTSQEFRDEFKIWQKLSYKIELLLKSDEDKSKVLMKLMENLNKSTDYNSNAKEEDYERIKHDILNVTQQILKKEWNQIKELE